MYPLGGKKLATPSKLLKPPTKKNDLNRKGGLKVKIIKPHEEKGLKTILKTAKKLIKLAESKGKFDPKKEYEDLNDKLKKY